MTRTNLQIINLVGTIDPQEGPSQK